MRINTLNTLARPCLFIVLLSQTLSGHAQDIEPRRWTPLPVGTNILGAGAVYTDGDIFVDPVLEIEDATVEAKTGIISFLHGFDLLGNSARLDFRLPYQDVTWEGRLAGEQASANRSGLADPRIRLSVNFLGAPALKGKAFQAYRAAHPDNTVAGAALAVSLPLGEYNEDKRLNLGKNRYIFRPQVGFVHTRGHWSYELTGSVFLYTDNNDFVGSNKLEQDPLFAAQTHLTYISSRHWWVSTGAAFDWGGETSVNGERKGDRKQDFLFGVSAGMPVSMRSSVKIAYVASRTQQDVGVDTNSIALGYSIRF
jgi:hypothetical protein